MKITQKILNKYYHAKKDFGPCINDDFNRAKKLLTTEEYHEIDTIHHRVKGIEGGRMTLREAKS